MADAEPDAGPGLHGADTDAALARAELERLALREHDERRRVVELLFWRAALALRGRLVRERGVRRRDFGIKGDELQGLHGRRSRETNETTSVGSL